jgi:hypothetical protein
VADADPTLLPWGYGVDRVTAMVVDPTRLLVYWEVTDEGIARARARLAPAAQEAATLALRIYDVTSIIFDGTNAHAHGEQPIERRHRQWTFEIGRPGSTVVVEVGLRDADGRFVRMARSRRADFPRLEPVAAGAAAWRTLTEQAWTLGAPADPVADVAAPDPRSGQQVAFMGPADRPARGGSSEWPYARTEEA